MTTTKIDLPDAPFGSADAKGVNWRAHHDEDPDDEELAETPQRVVLMLGFDPKDVEGGGNTPSDTAGALESSDP